jgi:hypothetical protein
LIVSLIFSFLILIFLKGKNIRDQHFSVVSRALEKAKNKNQRPLISAQDVVTCLNESYTNIHRGKIENNQQAEISIAIHFNRNEETIKRKYRFINNLNCYYNFQNTILVEDGETSYPFFSSIYSDLTDLIPVDSVLDDREEPFSYAENLNNNSYEEISSEARHAKIDFNLRLKKIMIEQIKSRNNQQSMRRDSKCNYFQTYSVIKLIKYLLLLKLLILLVFQINR